MNYKSRLMYFAVKWIERFNDPLIDPDALHGIELHRDCISLGFIMDTGESFSQICKKNHLVNLPFETQVSMISEIYPIGCKIYSSWLYFSHWAYFPDSIFKYDYRQMFIILLTRLLELAIALDDEKLEHIKEIKLEINRMISFKNDPKKRVYLKRIHIDDSGLICIKTYDDLEMQIHINPQNAKDFIKQLTDNNVQTQPYYGNHFGKWSSWSINQEGIVYFVGGFIGGEWLLNIKVIVSYIKHFLNLDQLDVLSDNINACFINHISIEYRQFNQVHSVNGNELYSYLKKESLVIDRQTMKICYTTESDEHKSTLGIQSPLTTIKVLDHIKLEEWISDKINIYDDIDLHSNEQRFYDMIILDHKGKKYHLTGAFYIDDLPNPYDAFIRFIQQETDEQLMGTIFDSSIYRQKQRRFSDVIVCSVQYNHVGKTYDYLTSNQDIHQGDEVLVGDKNNQIVKVIGVKIVNKDDLPMPYENYKWIVNKVY